MKLIIDTTESAKVTVKLLNPKTKKKIELQNQQKFGSQVLLPLIVKILKKAKINFNDLKEVEVNPGPGSFIGTRVGVTVANALSFALKIPINGKRYQIVIPNYEKSKFD